MEYRKRVAAVYLLGFFVDLVNLFIGNVAFPDIALAFRCDVAALAWVSTAYILGLTVVIPLGNWLAAAYGGKRVFIASLLLFMAGSLGAGLAGSLAQLIAWRALQGLGGGLLIPLGQTMTYRLYQPAERPGLTALILLVGQLAPALSPAVGGLIVDSLGWRWVFFLNLPLAALPLLLACLWLRDERESLPVGRLDWAGLLLGSLALLAVLQGLSELAQPQTWLRGGVALLAGLGLAAAYVRHARRWPQPILRLELLREPLLRSAMLMYLLVPGVFMGVSLVAMLYLQQVLGLAAASAGMLMLPWSLGAFSAISLTGRLYRRRGPRPLLLAGVLAQALGFLLLWRVSAAAQMPQLAAAYLLMGLGGTLCSSASQSTAFLRVAPERMGEASALWNINRQVSFCLGMAALSMLLNLLLAWRGVVDPAQPAWREAATEVFHLCFLIAAAGMLLPLWLGGRIGNRTVLQLLRQP
ncbi:MFS transporter [Chromobacterium sphagni]|uniref:MFS transporter n=1 Tax=Chromobacterium sphagni TaxID=1903179 RepID=A0ABX3CGY1_9NEIS|nr:MFS transporter [Chromobacterium sphagni]OHX21331.1 MFS transporter [Chromobacterium sphagni]